MKRTVVSGGKKVMRKWHLVDARGRVLGRLASEVVGLLMGKGKVEYTPNLDIGDFVVVVNAGEVAVTGRKRQDKIYRRHSQYPGGLKEESLASLLARRPERVIELAISGMLPKNKLRKRRMARLVVFEGSEHPYGDRLK